MSALPAEGDIRWRAADVSFVPLADIPECAAAYLPLSALRLNSFKAVGVRGNALPVRHRRGSRRPSKFPTVVTVGFEDDDQDYMSEVSTLILQAH